MIVHPELKIKSHLLLADDINTLYNVCSVHRGMFSTLGGVQYIGGISVHWGCSVHWGIFSTLGDIQ